jgi:Fur family ferric uptake transcriptional regulator
MQVVGQGARQRRSKQREVILDELRKLKTHPRSDELYSLVRQKIPNVSLGTVYRNLGQLHSEGMALEIYCGDFVRYDGNVSPHDHFLCRGCRRVWDFDEGQSGALDSYARQASGFQIDGHYTMYLGLCPDCLAGIWRGE